MDNFLVPLAFAVSLISLSLTHQYISPASPCSNNSYIEKSATCATLNYRHISSQQADAASPAERIYRLPSGQLCQAKHSIAA